MKTKRSILLGVLLLLLSVFCLFACEDAATTAPAGSGTLCENHTFGEWSVTVPATCNTAGQKTRTCSVCGMSETQPIAATGNHTFGEWTVITPATCTAEGEQRRLCVDCLTAENAPIPTTDHHYENGVCTVCHTPCDHAFGEWTITKAATCTAVGSERRTCNRCNTAETRELPMTAHQYQDDRCTVCGKAKDKTSEGLSFRKSDDNAYYIITGIGSCSDKDLILPAEHDGLPVRALAPLAFAGASVTSVTIPASISDFGLAPFNGCSSLTTVTLAEGTQTLPSCWLLSGTAVKEFVIPASVKTIGGGFFYNCSVTTLRFAGTTSDWNSITKEAHWYEPLSTSTVVCTNGSARLS